MSRLCCYGRTGILVVAACILSLWALPAANSDTACLSTDSGKSEKYQVTFHFVVANRKKNPVSGIEVSIPVPEDDTGQKISNFEWNLGKYRSKELRDQFGQKLLQVDIPELMPNEKTDLGYSCAIEIKPVRVAMDRLKCGSLSEIPEDIRSAYSNDVIGVYDLNSPLVRETADKLKEDYPNLVDRLKAIHDYVADRISYNLSGHWVPAPEVINRKTGSCSEYTFVFGALCRANGLPTRTVGSSHLRTSKDFPYKDTAWHRWIEVYLPPYGWIPFDPTLDRGKHPAQNCSGSYDFRTFRVSRGGVESNILGQSYIGCSNHKDELERDRYFVWVPLAQAGELKNEVQTQKRHEKRTETGTKP